MGSLPARWTLLVFGAGVWLGPPGNARGGDAMSGREAFAVLPLRSTAIDETLRDELSAAILAAAETRVGRDRLLVGPPRVGPLQGARSRAFARCMDLACLTEIGRALGAGWLLATYVGRVGQTYGVRLMLIDALRGRVLRKAEQLTSGGRQEAVVAAVARAVRELLSALPAPAPAPAVGRAVQAAPAWPAYACGSLLASAMGALGASVALGLRSQRRARRGANPDGDGSQRALVRARRDMHAARVAGAVGAGAALVGAALWALTGGGRDRSVHPVPTSTRAGVGVLVRVAY
jgi:hypothetical protein